MARHVRIMKEDGTWIGFASCKHFQAWYCKNGYSPTMNCNLQGMLKGTDKRYMGYGFTKVEYDWDKETPITAVPDEWITELQGVKCTPKEREPRTFDVTKYQTTVEKGVTLMHMSPEAIEEYRKIVVPGYVLSDGEKREYRVKFFSSVREFMDSLGVFYEVNYNIYGQIFDFYIPSTKTVILLAPGFDYASVGPNNFRDQSFACKLQEIFLEFNKLGYRVIVLEDEVFYARGERILDVIKYAVKPAKRIYARACEVCEIPSKLAKEFLAKYHVDGSSGLASIHLGLFEKGAEHTLENLLQVTTWSGMRMGRGTKSEYELARMSVNPDYCVVGGTSKFFKYFIKKYHPSYIHSYSANTWFNGSGYDKAGMLNVGQTTPSYGWIRYERVGDEIRPVRIPREKVQCKKFRVAYPEVVAETEANPGQYPSGVENAFCSYMGYYRTANCGNTIHAMFIDYGPQGEVILNERRERYKDK